jgi:acyl carrier protein
MTLDDVCARVRAIISGYLRRFRQPAEVAVDSRLAGGDLNLDSLAYLEITMEVEDEFDVELDDNRLAQLVTVGDFVWYVATCLGLEEVAA